MVLPIESVLPELTSALLREGTAVLQAPPGAGKTTKVPIALLPHISGRIVMLEPRRIAARTAAARIAELLDEPLGRRVGYRMRGDSVAGTRIEVVTEGILTRMLQTDPELSGTDCLIFDEFHERSLQADLGLALALEVRGALREDLRILVMSATLDAEPVAGLMGGAPVITSEGRMFPVDTHWADTALAPAQRRGRALADAVAAQVRGALRENDGSALVFLPGQGEINMVAQRLGDLPADIAVHPLYGAMPIAAQRAAIAPAKQGRKVVLATSIAETSLTIEGVRIVIDAGLARRARFDPASAMSRLVTERVTRAEAEQRRGRAGRMQPGVCYRMWTKGEEGALAAFAPPEITDADLVPLALELATWGAQASDLSFLTPPPERALAEAYALLHDLGCIDRTGLTAHGRATAAVPAHPRLAHMLLNAGGAGRVAADLAALLEARDPMRGAGSDLSVRLKAMHTPPFAEIRKEAKRLSRFAAKSGPRHSTGALLSLAYPDRIAKRRPGDAPRYHLSGGKGVKLAAEDPLAPQTLLVVAETDGHPTEATVRLALPVTLPEIRELHAHRLREVDICEWSKRHRKVEPRQRTMLGALILEDRHWPDAPDDAIAAGLVEGIRQLGLDVLGWSKASRLLRTRIGFVGPPLPDVTDDTLLATLEEWLAPHLHGQRSAADLGRFEPYEPLLNLLDWSQRQMLDERAPSQFTAPTGTRCPIDWSDPAHPSVEVRLQEVFGLTTHPTVNGIPLRIDLLSPARRAVQTTSDLPRFWATSYSDVRKDMRGRYPRHPWPEDPAAAPPTNRVKPRGT
ncbi:ATP-dependent helicase HrpB [Pontivivens nitratireducens]|uniref:ATP-dependent helicase HrpB n=1 Tax=Pontivivens nitratireducens TaxID=2758038 RepID=A0A6G7VK55_9RHOB|nr:ATP-dependent helicase HrpB [Pontibrevibacter nitratireducens]QIK40177.1 ATP-dependent helicase HrpB [Pontibrevibacter nitratireducens]